MHLRFFQFSRLSRLVFWNLDAAGAIQKRKVFLRPVLGRANWVFANLNPFAFNLSSAFYSALPRHVFFFVFFPLICHHKATSWVQTPCECQIFSLLIGCLLRRLLHKWSLSARCPAWLPRYLLAICSANGEKNPKKTWSVPMWWHGRW